MYDHLIIDGNNIAWRAASVMQLTSQQGKNVSVAFGMLNMIRSLLEDYQPKSVCVCWDFGASKSKEELFSEYKIHRKSRTGLPEELLSEVIAQINDIQNMLPYFGLKQLKRKGVEADDLIGLLCSSLKNVLVVSSDKDMFQVVNMGASLFYPPKNKLINQINFEETVGVLPEDYVFYRSILGDSCLTGDTNISLLDGTEKSIYELEKECKDFWVYSCDNGSIVPGKAKFPRLTKKKVKILKISLDSGESIKCTYDHKFLMSDGSYEEAQYLKENSSLMPLYRRIIDFKNKDSSSRAIGYEEMYNPGSGRWKSTHRMVAENIYGKSYKLVHHKNFNRFDNTPENLCFMDKLEHKELHSNGKSEQNRKRNIERWANDPEYRKYMLNVCSKAGKIGMSKNWSNPEFRKAALINSSKVGKITGPRNIRIYNMSEEKRKKTGEDNKKRWKEDLVFAEKMKKMFSATAKKTYERGKLFGGEIAKRFQNEKTSERNKVNWKDPIYRNSMLEILRRPRKERIKIFCICGKEMLLTEGSKRKYCSYSCSNIGSPRGFALKRHNHKVVSVEFSGYEDVYNIDVEKYHNFALSSGVFVHNSDGIPGLQWFGDVTAKKLIKEYGPWIDWFDAGEIKFSILESLNKRQRLSVSGSDAEGILIRNYYLMDIGRLDGDKKDEVLKEFLSQEPKLDDKKVKEYFMSNQFSKFLAGYNVFIHPFRMIQRKVDLWGELEIGSVQ